MQVCVWYWYLYWSIRFGIAMTAVEVVDAVAQTLVGAAEEERTRNPSAPPVRLLRMESAFTCWFLGLLFFKYLFAGSRAPGFLQDLRIPRGFRRDSLRSPSKGTLRTLRVLSE